MLYIVYFLCTRLDVRTDAVSPPTPNRLLGLVFPCFLREKVGVLWKPMSRGFNRVVVIIQQSDPKRCKLEGFKGANLQKRLRDVANETSPVFNFVHTPSNPKSQDDGVAPMSQRLACTRGPWANLGFEISSVESDCYSRYTTCFSIQSRL